MPRSHTFFVLLFIAFNASTLMASGTENWQATDGYRVEIDSSGWSLPVAIQFVPNPKNDPKSPLYYVSELRGQIKVVTQDRSVYTYADQIEDLRPKQELPHLDGEFGMTGLCLNEATGHVYATTVYRNGGLLFNKIMRFTSGSNNFGLTGTKDWEMIDLFSPDPASHSHQIGHCFIGSDQKFYVGIGDAHQHYKAQLLEHSSGKLIRMNLDGSAPTDNPFYDTKNPGSIQSYIYAYGLRNPFAIAEGPNQKVYIAENGPNIDKLLKIVPGRNYLWNGKNSSMLINGIVTWSPSLGPATLAYVNEHPIFPKWNQRLLVSASTKAYIDAVWIDDELGAKSTPEKILHYKGNQETEPQYLVPIALGPDGLYFSGFLPQADGETHIMKLVPSDTAPQPQQALSGEAWYAKLECAGCHSISGKGGKLGPALDNLVLRLEDRLNSQAYLKQLDEVDQLQEPLFVDKQEARQKMRELSGKEKIEFWIKQRLAEPKFDSSEAQMPNFQLNSTQIEALTQFLMTLSAEDKRRQKSSLEQWADDLKFYFNTHLNAWLATMLVLGIVIGFFIKSILSFFIKLVFRRR